MTTIEQQGNVNSTERPVGLFAIPTDNPNLIQSQVKALSGRIPLLYFIVFVNTAAVAWTHYGIAPDFLTIGFPTIVLIAGLMRARAWVKSRGRAISDADARRLLNGTVVVGGVFGAMFLVWGLALYQYGDAYAQGHVVFYMAITVISGIFCLMQLRSAALLLAGVTVIPFSIFFLATGRPVFIAIAVNTLLVSAAMVYVLLTYSRDFANMVAFQEKLVETHKAETERVRLATEIERAAQREILKHAGRFEVALNNMLHGLCMFDVEERLIVCNQRYAKMYALPDDLTQPGARWRDIVAHRVKTLGYRDLGYDDVLAQHRAIDLTKNETTTTRVLRDGRVILVRHQPIKEGGWVATHEDITERLKSQELLTHMAHHDVLTGLANRHLLQERMERAVAGLQRGEAFAVLCVGLNHIKTANDALGHAVGDALLREVAARLSACVLESDTVARIGGSEFAILQVGIAGPDEPGDLAEHVLDVLTRPYEIKGNQINIDASIGIALAPHDETAGPPLLRQADIALSRAKAEGSKVWRSFEAAMDAELQSRRGLEIDLRKALVNNEFEVYFQPINDAKSKSIRSFEALVRWRHPDRGMISPAEFIPLAEQTGLIVPLGEWVLRTACKEAIHWPSDVRVSVNLSACQFRAGDLIGMVRKALADTGLPPRRLELEITESVLLDGSSDNLAMLHELRDLGAKIAMDDFGTGYSSLSYLRSFPFDKIKIDQSFVKNIDQRDAREIVRAIANLGRTLGITTTAEGVETEAQLKTMIAYRCTEVQGYLFSRPVPASEVRGLLDMFYQARQAA
jgi:diguanylate cyclase (GGDEF)-like protein